MAQTQNDYQSFRARGAQMKNADDVVAQVLNYVTTGNDKGTSEIFWWKEKDAKCYYFQNPTIVDEALAQINVMDFEQYDRMGLSFKHSFSEHGGTPLTILTYDGKEVLLTAVGHLDLDRATRGLDLVYERHCTSKRRSF